jgi:hypothetical protein
MLSRPGPRSLRPVLGQVACSTESGRPAPRQHGPTDRTPTTRWPRSLLRSAASCRSRPAPVCCIRAPNPASMISRAPARPGDRRPRSAVPGPGRKGRPSSGDRSRREVTGSTPRDGFGRTPRTTLNSRACPRGPGFRSSTRVRGTRCSNLAGSGPTSTRGRRLPPTGSDGSRTPSLNTPWPTNWKRRLPAAPSRSSESSNRSSERRRQSNEKGSRRHRVPRSRQGRT